MTGTEEGKVISTSTNDDDSVNPDNNNEISE